MASQNPNTPGDNPVRAEIATALGRKGLRRESPCPICGAGDWVINDDTTVVPTVGADGSPPSPDHGVEAAVIWCNGCGFLRLHALSVLVAD